MQYRIITDGSKFKVQFTKWWWAVWVTVSEENEKGEYYKVFDKIDEARDYIKYRTPSSWTVVE